MTASALALGNSALRENAPITAIRAYLNRALSTHAAEVPGLAPLLESNLELARDEYLAQRQHGFSNGSARRVGACAWDLGDASSERTKECADAYRVGGATVEIIGGVLSDHAAELWAPLQGARHPVRPLVVHEAENYLQHALKFVLRHPYDVVHLTSGRGSARLLGLVYELVWGAVIVGPEEEGSDAEKAESVLSETHRSTPALPWTDRLAPLLMGDRHRLLSNL